MVKYNTKAIVTIPAWAEALHEGTGTQSDTINTAVAAYALVPLVFRATRLVCNALVGVPVRFYKGKTEVEWPFPDASLRRLLWKSQAAMSLMGANYVEKIPRNMSKKVGSVGWVNPTTMNLPKLIVNEDGSIDYEFSQKNKTDVKWDLSTMIYMREFSLRNDVGPGDSSASVSLNDAALLRYMSRFAARFFETGAMPITVLQIDGIVDKDETKRIESFFKRAATRIRNAFNVLALGRAIEPKFISQPLKDLVMPELHNQARRSVADAFDFHPSLLDEAPNMATAKEHRLSLYEDSVRPRAMILEEDFNQQLLKPMGIEMKFAFEEMDIFQEDESAKAGSVETLTRAISTDPEIAEFVMNTVFGYDLDEEQQQKFDELIAKKKTEKSPPPPTEPVEEKSLREVDLDKWERKAVKRFNKDGSAVCSFESNNISRSEIERISEGLPGCKTAEEIRSLFGQTENDVPWREVLERIDSLKVQSQNNGAEKVLEGIRLALEKK